MNVRSTPIAASLVLLAGPALAQPSAQDEAQALALFKDAIAALDRADYATACPKFDAAVKLYPSPATQINLARCFEHDGKIVSAWAAYQRVLVLNRDTREEQRRVAIEKMAIDGAAAVEGRLPKLRIVVPSPPPGLRVTEDGQELSPASWGEALPVDPGPHEIAATAPGFVGWRRTVTAAEGKTGEVNVALTASTPPETAPPADTPSRRGVPVWAWAVGGAGLALGVVAAGFRADWARIDAKQAAAGCGPNLQSCPRSYTPLSDDNAQKDRDRALFIGLGVAGVAGVGAGVVGIVVGSLKKGEPRSASVRAFPLIGSRMSGAVLEGGF